MPSSTSATSARAGQGLRHAGPGAALLVVLEVPRAGLSRRLGGARALHARGRAAEAHDHPQRLGARAGARWPPTSSAAASTSTCASCGGRWPSSRPPSRRPWEHFFPAGTRATRPAGGYFLWVELPAGTDALAIHRQALALGISVAPGPIFSATRAFTNCLRLNYGHAWDARAEQALETLGRLAKAQ